MIKNPMMTSTAPHRENAEGNIPKNIKSERIANGIVIERPTVAIVGDVRTTLLYEYMDKKKWWWLVL
jgi:hypothetical protein